MIGNHGYNHLNGWRTSQKIIFLMLSMLPALHLLIYSDLLTDD